MSDAPQMNPDELSWAFQNAGRPPAARQTTSEEFAAKARANEASQRHAEHALEQQRHRQDSQYNQAVHAQDMAAARAQHLALLRQYSFLDRARAELGALAGGEFGWKQGFVIGLTVGAIACAIFMGRKKR